MVTIVAPFEFNFVAQVGGIKFMRDIISKGGILAESICLPERVKARFSASY